MKSLSKIVALLFSTTIFFACEDTSSIGSSILQEDVEIIVDSSFVDSTFVLNAKTVMSDSIQSRTLTQLLGKIDAEGYGYLESDIVTQFMPAGRIDTTNVTANDIDSIKLLLQIPNGGYVGDSIAPMGLEIYKLNESLKSPIYSNFNPSGKYSELLGSEIYSANALGLSDSIGELSYRTVYVDLPLDLGKYFFDLYKKDPYIYLNPYDFAKEFKGIYIKNSYGSGRIMKITNAQVKLYYHKTVKMESTGKDSTYYKVGNYFAVTPEIVTNNNITYKMSPKLEAMIQNGDKLLVAPTGTNIEFDFPTQKIVDFYNSNNGNLSIINSLIFEIPVSEIHNEHNIAPPPYILLIKKSKMTEFFEKCEVTDNENSFYAAYNSTYKCYQFTDMRTYITNMVNKSEIKPEDYEFCIIPVSVNTETSSSYYSTSVYLSDIVPYVETPAMAKLHFDEAKIIFTFSKQTLF